MLEIPLNLIFPQAALFLFPALLMNLLKVCAKKKKKQACIVLDFHSSPTGLLILLSKTPESIIIQRPSNYSR